VKGVVIERTKGPQRAIKSSVSIMNKDYKSFSDSFTGTFSFTPERWLFLVGLKRLE